MPRLDCPPWVLSDWVRKMLRIEPGRILPPWGLPRVGGENNIFTVASHISLVGLPLCLCFFAQACLLGWGISRMTMNYPFQVCIKTLKKINTLM